MSDLQSDVVDVVFGLRGGTIPSAHADALWRALLARLPELESVPDLAVLPLAGLSSSGTDHYLTRHTRLILRLPRTGCDQVLPLQGTRLDIGSVVEVGAATIRPLLPATVVHAHLVSFDEADEVRFLARCQEALDEQGIAGDLICGRRKRSGDRHGYSLMVREITPVASLRLQEVGIGDGRRQGCGIFVPHKSTDPVGA